MNLLKRKNILIKLNIASLIILMGILLLLFGCSAQIPTAPIATASEAKPTETKPTEAPPTELPPTQIPTEVPTSTTEPTETEQTVDTQIPVEESLPAKPRQINFTAEDGTALVGTYYPPAQSQAPIILLMHWARGDQTDWVEIAQWLQNRTDEYAEEDVAPQSAITGLLPQMPEGLSYAVFTFDFRGFGESVESGSSGSPDGWLMDAKAAVSTATNFSGVDGSRYLNIGASIGSDGAADTCLDGCAGALSLSPGGYLGIPYSEAVANLDSNHPGALIWCIASEGDTPSSTACQSAEGSNYIRILYPGSAHGMDMFQPGLEPDIGQILQDFVFFGLGMQ